jgi:catechol 2,3-dioxygenase-like lactoylglutathione lyase family enzyme
MHFGSIYLVVNDFEKSLAFYEKLLEMPVTGCSGSTTLTLLRNVSITGMKYG